MDGGAAVSGFDVKAWAASLKEVRFPMFGFLDPEVMMADWPLTAADRRRVAGLVGQELGIEMDHRDEESFYVTLSELLRIPGGLAVVERGIALGGAKAAAVRTIQARIGQVLDADCGEDLRDAKNHEEVARLLADQPDIYERVGKLVVWHQTAREAGTLGPISESAARARKVSSRSDMVSEFSGCARAALASMLDKIVSRAREGWPHLESKEAADVSGPLPPFLGARGLMSRLAIDPDVLGLFLSTAEVDAIETDEALRAATDARLHDMARSLRGAALLRAIFVPDYRILDCRRSLLDGCSIGPEGADEVEGAGSGSPTASTVLIDAFRGTSEDPDVLAAAMPRLWYVTMTGDDGALGDEAWKRVFDLVALGARTLPEWRDWATWRLSLNEAGFRGEDVPGAAPGTVEDGRTGVAKDGISGEAGVNEAVAGAGTSGAATEDDESAASLWAEEVELMLLELQHGKDVPTLKVAEDVLASAQRLVELARQAAEEKRKASEVQERLNRRVETIRDLAASLSQDETKTVAEACRGLPEIRAGSETLETLLVSLEMSLTGLAGQERELADAIGAQAKASETGDGAEIKRLARLVVQKADALEEAVGRLDVPGLVERLKAAGTAGLPSGVADPAEDGPEPERPDPDGVQPSGAAQGATSAGGDDKSRPQAATATDRTSEGREGPRAVIQETVAPKAGGDDGSGADRSQGAPGRDGATVEEAPAKNASPAKVAPSESSIAATAGGEAGRTSSLNQDAVVAWSRLVARDEAGLAWHLSSVLEAMGCLPAALPRPQYLKALCFGSTVMVSDDPSTIRMKDELVGAIAEPRNTNEAMLAMAALVRPALLALESGALQTAIGLPLWHATFMHELQQALTSYQKSGQFLTQQSLRRPPDAQNQAKLSAAATRDLENYGEQAPKLRINFHRADLVWKELFKRDGAFGKPISDAAAGRTDEAVAAFQDLLRRFNGDIGAIDGLVDRIDDEVSRPGGKEAITAKARLRLRNLIQQALTTFSGWLDTAAARAADGADDRMAPIRDELEAAARTALAGAAALVEESGDAVEAATVKAFGRAMEDLIAAIRPEGEGLRQRDPYGLLHDGFLRIPGQRFGGAREPEPYVPEDILDAILAYARGQEKASWEQVFADRMAERSHIATARVLAILELRGVSDAEIARLDRQRQADIDQARADLVRERHSLREELDQALAQDAVRDSETMALLEEIEAIEPAKLPIDLANSGGAATIADFPAATRALEEIRRGIEKSKAEITARLTTEIDEMKAAGRLLADDEVRIRARLGRNDYVSAADMIELVREGESGFTRKAERPFRTFFPAVAEAMAAETGQKLMREVLSACQSGARSGPFDFSQLTEPEKRSDSAKAMHDWHHLRSPQSKQDKAESVANVLTAIGFRGVKAKRAGEGDRKRVVLNVEAEQIVNPRICPIPYFGSECHGQWRVTVWTGDATPEEIVADAAKGSHVADMAIVGSRMSLDARRKLAQVTRRDRTPLLVLDESLYVWLLMQTEYRLPMFFDCALPFSWCNPYPAAHGPVPVESFYGRADEIEEIVSPRGSSLVYGGRQLGKSALLAQVSKRAHKKREGELAYHLDLKSLGADGRPERVWSDIGRHLYLEEILTRHHETPNEVAEAIERWLAADPKRSMLLLLDEMDDFLVADGERHYENVVLMRALMDKTQRRCKFVLAGLHDVQRASTTANTPLVHFGDPICVGPFYSGSDKKAARQMVIQPLAAAGYEFSDPWLPLRILSQLHLFPSLVGVFCRQVA